MLPTADKYTPLGYLRLARRVLKTGGAAREKRGRIRIKTRPRGRKRGWEQKTSPLENKKGGRQKYTPMGYPQTPSRYACVAVIYYAKGGYWYRNTGVGGRKRITRGGGGARAGRKKRGREKKYPPGKIKKGGGK